MRLPAPRGLGPLPVSPLGLGCMGMSEFSGPGDEQESIATIGRALDLGVDAQGCTPGQLAWLLAQGDDVVPVPGTRRSRLEEDVGALGVALTAADLTRLDELTPAGAAAGDRDPDMRSIDR